MDGRTSWNDSRLDDFYEQMQRLVPTIEKVAVLDDRMKTLGKSVDQLNTSIQDIVGKPIQEARKRKEALRIGLICAAVGGVTSGLGAIILSGGLH